MKILKPSMRISLYLTLGALLAVNILKAQDGKMLSKEPVMLPDSILRQIDSLDPAFNKIITGINLYKVVYLSDGLKVIGFIAEPKAKGKYPCIIANRGGRWNFSLWRPKWVAWYLGTMASWGYTVVASQYRGS